MIHCVLEEDEEEYEKKIKKIIKKLTKKKKIDKKRIHENKPSFTAFVMEPERITSLSSHDALRLQLDGDSRASRVELTSALFLGVLEAMESDCTDFCASNVQLTCLR